MKQGEDTFGDSDESEEDDVVVTSSARAGYGGAAAAAARPRLGLGASLASIVHGRGGNAPTCNLEDHPIQVSGEVFCFGPLPGFPSLPGAVLEKNSGKSKKIVLT